jgi:hypothetical protein
MEPPLVPLFPDNVQLVTFSNPIMIENGAAATTIGAAIVEERAVGHGHRRSPGVKDAAAAGAAARDVSGESAVCHRSRGPVSIDPVNIENGTSPAGSVIAREGAVSDVDGSTTDAVDARANRARYFLRKCCYLLLARPVQTMPPPNTALLAAKVQLVTVNVPPSRKTPPPAPWIMEPVTFR